MVDLEAETSIVRKCRGNASERTWFQEISSRIALAMSTTRREVINLFLFRK
jgi:hypothetical protein